MEINLLYHFYFPSSKKSIGFANLAYALMYPFSKISQHLENKAKLILLNLEAQNGSVLLLIHVRALVRVYLNLKIENNSNSRL